MTSERTYRRETSKTRLFLMMLTLGAAYFFSNFHRLSLGVVGAVVAQDFGLSPLQLGTLGSALFYSYAFMQIPCGVISDRVSARALITGSCALAAAGSVLFAATHAFWGLVAARVLTGIATAFVYVPALAAIRNQFGDAVFGTMTGILVAMGQLGSVCASAPLKFMTDLAGWRMTFDCIGAVSVLLVAASWFLILETPKSAGAARPQAAGGWRAAFRLSCLSLALWFFVTGGARLSFQGLWGAKFFTDALEMNASTSSLMLMCVSLGCIAGSLVLGRLSDRLGSVRTVVLSSVLFALFWSGFMLLTPWTPALTTGLAGFALGALGAGGFTVGFSCIRAFSDKSCTGMLVGVNNCAAFGGSALFIQFTGHYMNFFQSETTLTQFSRLFAAFALLSLAATLFVFFCNRNFSKGK